MTQSAACGKLTVKRLLLGIVALVFCEQVLIKYLDYRAKWDDAAFQAYLASAPSERNTSGAAFACRYQKIAIIYRYRICLQSISLANEVTKHWRLELVGLTGYLSLMLEEDGGRETWDRTQIWLLDDKLQFKEDLRK